MKLDFSILEFGNIKPPKVYAHHVIENLFNYAQTLDALGYKRFWMSEHYSPDFAWFSPEILLPLLVASTEKIKIGQAGVLLNYHSPLRIAHNFSMLSALFPDRIDLGVVPAGVSDEVMKALIDKQKHPNKAFYAEQVQQLFDLIEGNALTPDNPESLRLPMQGTAKPQMWVLGISDSSVPLAVKNKADFCISLFHVGAKYSKQKDVIKKFKEAYYKEHGEIPGGVASVICICSEDKNWLQKREKDIAKSVQREGYVIGSPEACKQQLYHLAEELNLDEIVLNASGSSFEEKQTTIEHIGKHLIQNTKVEAAVPLFA